MQTRTFTVDRIGANEEHAVVGMLTRAFYDDPLFGFLLPDLVQQTKGLMGFMQGGVIDAVPFGEVWVAHAENGKIASAAVWLPPEGYPRGVRREFRTVYRSFPAFAHAGKRVVASMRLLAEVDKAHHALDEPHYYLAILGTDPLYQRTGAGSTALQPVLDKCDEQGMPAYVETQKEENLAYYARHAFELTRKIEAKGCPPVWTLWRKPR
jgi:GNAT superfamily N-acetyltransferase